MVLSETDRTRITEAIRNAEAGHRGEIVVHVEPRSWGDPLKRAAKLYRKLGVERTREGTGVLLYLATSTRGAAVWAGPGITGGDDPETWKPVFAALANPDPITGICDAIAAAGAVLATHAAGADAHGNELGDGASS
ncbi:MAG TPA: TPM domain-containing protein [Kofleriaceae bacterium]